MTKDLDSQNPEPGRKTPGPERKAVRNLGGLPPLPPLNPASDPAPAQGQGRGKERQPSGAGTAIPPLPPLAQGAAQASKARESSANSARKASAASDVAAPARSTATASATKDEKPAAPPAPQPGNAEAPPPKPPTPPQGASIAASPQATGASPAKPGLAPTPQGAAPAPAPAPAAKAAPAATPPAPAPAAPPTAPASTPAPSSPPAEAFRAGPIDIPTQGSQNLFSGFTRIGFVLLFLLPVLASAYYLIAVASDRYAVEVKFAIRSPNGLGSSDLLGLVTAGAAGGSTQSDSYMVIDYLESRQFLEAIADRVDLSAIYGTDAADSLMRLPADATAEDRVDFLPRVLDASFDSTSQIITVETQAFTPEDAKTMAEAVLEATGAMINEVSEQARRDTVRLAEQELARAEVALKEQRRRVALFRDSEQKIDPQATVAAQENVLSRLQIDLANELAEMTNLRKFLEPDSPRIRVLQSRIDSIENQIAAERARLGAGSAEGPGGNGETLNSSIAAYEELAVDLDFRQRAYVSALASLESARIEADRQQRYLAAFVLPSLPQAPTYPRVPLTLAMIAAVSFLIWSILSMFVHILREHLS